MFNKYIFHKSKTFLSAFWKPKLFDNIENVFVAPNLDFIRYKARKGTRAAALATKRARKLQEANKPAPVPKFLQKKVKVSTALEKKRCVDENWLEEQPIDNVWNMKLYRGKPHSVVDALNILKSMHMPSLLNDQSALVYATVEIDLKLKKKGKFMDDFSGIVTYPYEFDIGKKNRIIALCKETADQQKAAEAGAIYTGSTALIKQILSGNVSTEDFDYVVCHPDMYKECNSLRGILKRRYPSVHNGLLRLDIDQGVASFIKGIEYNMMRSSIEPDFGWVDVYIGRLNMPQKEVEANLKYVLNIIDKHKPVGINHLFIIRTVLWCEKVREKFKIPHWEYLPHYPENGISVADDDEGIAQKSS